MRWTSYVMTALCAVLAATPASAAVLTSVTANSTTGIAGVTTWPTAFSVATPGANPSASNSAENNYGGSSLFSLGQSFVAPTSGPLSNLQITISGTAPVSFNVALYNAGANDVSDIGSGTYTPGSGGYSNNLFSDTSLQTWTGYTAPNATAAVLNFALSGADQVPLVAGNSYIFEISSATNPNGMIWFRNGANAGNYLDGQAYRQRSPLNGNNMRDMSLAATVVPEPTSAMMIVLGGALAVRRRRTR